MYGVLKFYGDVYVVCNVFVYVFSGEVFGIVGESGFGKFMFLCMMNFEEMLDMGSYMLDLLDVVGNFFDLDCFVCWMFCVIKIGIVY